MRKQTREEKRSCPKCGGVENQVKAGYNRSGTQRCICKECKYKYTQDGKTREYSEEIKQQAIKTYYSGVSGRGVGKLFGMSKSNVTNWIKKPNQNLWISEKTDRGIFELDELYWYINKKSKSKTRENAYIMTMISRVPRQIVGFEVQLDKSSFRLQGIVDNSVSAEKYCTDGYVGYIDVIFPGEHIRNVRDKCDTHISESINADLRHYIPGLARKSRCFYRSLETFQAVLRCLWMPATSLARRS